MHYVIYACTILLSLCANVCNYHAAGGGGGLEVNCSRWGG